MREKPLTSEKPPSNTLTWIVAGGCGLAALFSCVICGGIGAWFYFKSDSQTTMEGAWEFAGPNLNPNLRCVQLITETQFVVVFSDRNTKAMVLMHGGPYTFKDNIYKHKIEYTSPGIQATLLGTEQSLTARPRADAMDVTGVLTNGVPINETWNRLAKKSTTVGHEGAWEGVNPRQPPNLRSVKLIAGDQFVITIYDRNSRTTLAVIGGTCNLNGNAYTETPEYGSPALQLLGQRQSLTARVQADQMDITGVLTNGLKVNDTWRRIK